MSTVMVASTPEKRWKSKGELCRSVQTFGVKAGIVRMKRVGGGMKLGLKNDYWQTAALSGAVSALIYMVHVTTGGILWDGYSHVRQTISELTGNGAPNAGMLRIFTLLYGIFGTIFAIVVYVLFRKYKTHKLAQWGALLLLLMHAVSLIGYSLFPLEEGGEVLTFSNFMHLGVTAIVVIATIGSLFTMGYGLWLTKKFRKIGLFTLVCAVVIVLSGVATPIVLSNELPFAGLVERILIYTLQLWTIVLSFYLYRVPKTMGST